MLRSCLLPLSTLTAASLVVLSAGTASAATPSAATCKGYGASRSLPAITALAPTKKAPRAFALQFKQQARYVRTAATFRTAIECQLRRYVVPYLVKGRPNLVVMNEDLGLMTVGIGSRGRAARKLIGTVPPECIGKDLCATLKTLDALGSSYRRQIDFYTRKFGAGKALNPLSSPLLAATDTQVRDFLGTMSALARKYGIYLVASGPLARFKETTDPKTVAALRDPDLKHVKSVYVATAKPIYNTALVWGPKDVRGKGPTPLRNVVQRNDKVPLTGIEIAQDFTAGPSTGTAAVDNLRPYTLPGTKARLGIATSLPAFTFGEPSPGVDPCSNTSLFYMRCLNKLGANVVVQDEANPGSWATDPKAWQPLSWMGSGWRNVTDPSVKFTYNITAFMVGSLADLTFDGQSSITQRGLKGARCAYVGNGEQVPGENLYPDVGSPPHGPQSEFLVLAPWVTGDAPRTQLQATGRKLAPGSGDKLENDYLETALVADLPFPASSRRKGCVTRAAPGR